VRDHLIGSLRVRPDRVQRVLDLAALATQVYLIMYVLMFTAAMKLRRSQPDHPRGYRAPALGLLCVLGMVSSVAALVIGFIPPAQFGHSNPFRYAALILAGILAIGILPPLLLDRLRKPGWKAAAGGPSPQ
jgi:amino acid transporter